MATLQQALKRIDTICPNAWDDAAKLLWLNECESMIQTRILGIAPGECVTYDVNSDRSTVLLVPAPFDRLYVYYVIAMCDYAAHETAHYADSMALFNAALDEYAKWYQRTNGAAASVPGVASQIAANTAARHSHANKRVLDGITAAKTAAWDAKAGTAAATQSAAGLMSAADKAKLNGIERGANKTTVPTALKNPNALTIKIGDTTVTYVQAIADAIREKTGGAETYKIAQMGDAVRSIPSKDNIVHADIPDYIKTAALEVAKKVQAVRTSESIVFIAASDAHQLDTSADIVNGNKHAGMAMKALAYILPGIDFACYLGDYTAGSATTTLDEGRKHFAEINADIGEAFKGVPQFRTLGNHDALQYSKAQNGSVLSPAELYNVVGAYNAGAIMGSTTSGYCYRDFNNKKLRVICLNTAENSEKEYVSDAQKLWFANTLKAVGAKAGWNVLILSHHPLDWGGVCVLSNIVKAYVDGSSITVSSGNTINFSGSNSAKILAAIHGHVHCFKAAKLNAIASGTGTEYNIWRVATPNMCFARNNEYGTNGSAEYYGIEFGETTTYNKTANSAKDTAFVVNVVNPSQQKIYSYCYGAGYDREIFTGIQTVAVTGVTLNAASGELTIGGQTTLTATVKPADASNKTVTWASSAPTVASVVNGVVTALAPGSAKITVKTADGGFTAEYALTVKAATSDLLAAYGYADNTRLSTSSGSEKAATGYVTIGHTAAIPIDKTRYPNGATIRVTGAVNCLGNNWSGGNNGGDSAFVLYTTGGTQFSNAGYIENKTTAAGTFTVDADKTGFTLNIASLSAPRYIKFCVKGAGANLTATLTPK